MCPFYYKNILKIDGDNFFLKMKKWIFSTLALWKELNFENFSTIVPHFNLDESLIGDSLLNEDVLKIESN